LLKFQRKHKVESLMKNEERRKDKTKEILDTIWN